MIHFRQDWPPPNECDICELTCCSPVLHPRISKSATRLPPVQVTKLFVKPVQPSSIPFPGRELNIEVRHINHGILPWFCHGLGSRSHPEVRIRQHHRNAHDPARSRRWQAWYAAEAVEKFPHRCRRSGCSGSNHCTLGYGEYPSRPFQRRLPRRNLASAANWRAESAT